MTTLAALVFLSHMTVAITASGFSCGPTNVLHDSDIDLAASQQAVELEVINNTSQDDCSAACCDREEADKCNVVIFERSSSSCTLMACTPQEVCVFKDSNDHEITFVGQGNLNTTTQAVKTEETTSASTTQLSDITGNNSTMVFNTSERTSTPVVESTDISDQSSTTQLSESTNISDHTSTTTSETSAISDQISTTQLIESTTASDHTSTPVSGNSNDSDHLSTTQVSGSSSPSDQIDTTPVSESEEASGNISTTQVSDSVNALENISTTQASETSSTSSQTKLPPQSGGSNVTNTVQSTGPSPLSVTNNSVITSTPTSELSNSTSSSALNTVSTTLHTSTAELDIKSSTPDSQSSSVVSNIAENSTLSITTVSTQVYNTTISKIATTTTSNTVLAPVNDNSTEAVLTTGRTDDMNETTVSMGETFDSTTSLVPETSKSDTNEEEHALQTTPKDTREEFSETAKLKKENDTGESIQSTTSNPELPSGAPSSAHTTAVVNVSTTVEPASGLVNSSASSSSDVAAHKFEPLSAGLIAALSLGIIFFFAVLVLLGKRLFNSWQRRHYNRMDYLINGMYN